MAIVKKAISWLGVPPQEDAPPGVKAMYDKADEKLGFVPNVLRVYSLRPAHLELWNAFYDDVVRYNAGGAAWTYPISGMGFSALLLWLGVIQYRQADFPFAAIEIAAATPIAAYVLYQLWRAPTIARLLGGYAVTLLAFLFFGRYFQGNYLGYIVAVATPVPFLRREARPARAARRPRRATVTERAAQPAATPSLRAASAVDARSIE